MAIASSLLEELTAVLEYYYDDDAESEDVQLAELHDEHASPTSQDAMALALDDYVAMADPIRSELDGLAGFSAETIDEGSEIAIRLRQASAPQPASATANTALFHC